MSCDVACVGVVSLDLTFAGLPAVPQPGQELHGTDFLVTVGGIANVAIALTRLGLAATVAYPVSHDVVGQHIARLLAEHGVEWAGPPAPRGAVTAVMPVGGDRAMATYEPPSTVDPATLAALAPRAVVLPLDALPHAPAGARIYAGTGYADIARHRPLSGDVLVGADALIVNETEGLLLTGCDTAEDAARALGGHVPTAIVTAGARGAVAADGGRLVSVPAPAVDAVDTTCAGDIFTAAYVWADLRGLPIEERLRLATVAGALSVRSYSNAGAPTCGELERATAAMLTTTTPAGVHTEGMG